MNYNEVLAAAREAVTRCKVCPVCNGMACGNVVPGPGSKAPGNAAARNYQKWQEVCVNMDTLCPNVANPDISFELFGRKFVAPIFAAPIGALMMNYGSSYTDPEYNAILVKAAAEYGIMAFTGEGIDDSVLVSAADEMAKVGGVGCHTIKPFSVEKVCEKLDILNEKGVFAAAMDIDAAGLPHLRAASTDAGSKTVDELRTIVEHAKIPFIVKGIMTVAGAKKAVEAGAAGIVVSNHGGRVQGGVPSTAEVLPAIAEAVKGKTTLFVDGGIRSGVDVFRALSLGADAVLIGRPITVAVHGSPEEGLRLYMDKIVDELKATMTMCGAANLSEITREKIWMEK